MEKQDKNTMYKDLNKYFLSAYAVQELNQGNTKEGELIAKVHFKKNGDLEGLLDTIGLKGTLLDALKIHNNLYQSKLVKFKVNDALEYLKAPEEVKKGLAEYSKKTVEDLTEDTIKYQKAIKNYEEAKTKEESNRAFEQKNKYERTAKVYMDIMKLNSDFMKEKSAPLIADYNRKKLAEEYKAEAEK